MTSRTTTSTVSFAHPFNLTGFANALPAGDYEICVDEELLQSLSFTAYQRKATYLVVRSRKGPNSVQMHSIDPRELELAQSLDAERFSKTENSETALPPLEEPK